MWKKDSTPLIKGNMKGLTRNETTATNGNGKPHIDSEKCSFRVECRRSPIHRWGVFALEPIPARRRIIEYTGEKIDEEEAIRRAGRGLLRVFSLDDKWLLDGAVGGSGAELINHSCDPNLQSYSYGGHIFLSSIRPIDPGEELTYDYHIDDKDFDIPCKCGAKKCRGSLGR